MPSPEPWKRSPPCRLIVVGGHTRSIGKTQLVCDLIGAFRSANWLAGKITQYGHGICTRNGQDCDCAPTEHIVAFDWESNAGAADSGRFLQAGAGRSFWLRTKQGFLAEGMPRLREALSSVAESARGEGTNVIIESNSLLQFVKPSLYLTVIDPARDDFKDSARQMLDRTSLFVFRRGLEHQGVARTAGFELPAQFLRHTPSVVQREGEPLPEPLFQAVKRLLGSPASVFL